MLKISRHLHHILAIAVCALFTSLSASGQAPDKDSLELQNYTLTTSNVTRFWETFSFLAKVAKDHPELTPISMKIWQQLKSGFHPFR